MKLFNYFTPMDYKKQVKSPGKYTKLEDSIIKHEVNKTSIKRNGFVEAKAKIKAHPSLGHERSILSISNRYYSLRAEKKPKPKPKTNNNGLVDEVIPLVIAKMTREEKIELINKYL